MKPKEVNLEEEIQQYFNGFGRVDRVVLPKNDANKEKNQRFCLVRFSFIENKEKMFERTAFRLNNKIVI